MVAQENRLEISSLCAHTLSSLQMYVGTSCNTTLTRAAAHIYMHGLTSVDWVNNHRNALTQVFKTFKYLCTYTLFWCHIQILVYVYLVLVSHSNTCVRITLFWYHIQILVNLNMISDQSNIAASPEQGM